MGLFYPVWGQFAHDFGTCGPACRHQFTHGLRLESDYGLGQHRVIHARRAAPWGCTLFHLHTQQVEALDIGSSPLLAGHPVAFERLDEVRGERLQLAILVILDEVLVVFAGNRFIGLFRAAKVHDNVAILELGLRGACNILHGNVHNIRQFVGLHQDIARFHCLIDGHDVTSLHTSVSTIADTGSK